MNKKRAKRQITTEASFEINTIGLLRLCCEQTVMLGAIVKGFEAVQASESVRVKECEELQDTCSKLERESAAFLRFFDDVNLILSGSRDTLCGSKWINAASLLEARNRYAKAMEEL